MDAVRASTYLVSPWREQKRDWPLFHAAWAAVAAENPWIEMRECEKDGPWYAYCTLCGKWCQDDYAASKKCVEAVHEAGYKPGFILTNVIQNKQAQQKAASADTLTVHTPREDYGNCRDPFRIQSPLHSRQPLRRGAGAGVCARS